MLHARDGYRLFYWTEAAGLVNLEDLLVNTYDLDLGGKHLGMVKGVSDDGQTIVGNRDVGAGWIVRLGGGGGGEGQSEGVGEGEGQGEDNGGDGVGTGSGRGAAPAGALCGMGLVGLLALVPGLAFWKVRRRT